MNKQVIFILIAIGIAVWMTACSGSNNSPNTGTTAAGCVTSQTYNAQGQLVPTCTNAANPYGTNYGYGYGTAGYGYGTAGYGTAYGYGYGTAGYGGSNPCMQYSMQYGVNYTPTMMGGTLMCVLQ